MKKILVFLMILFSATGAISQTNCMSYQTFKENLKSENYIPFGYGKSPSKTTPNAVAFFDKSVGGLVIFNFNSEVACFVGVVLEFKTYQNVNQ